MTRGLGNEIGLGMGAFVGNFTARQDQLRQQQLQDQQWQSQLQQQALDQRYREQQQAMQQRQQDFAEQNILYNRQQAEKQQAISGREQELVNVIAPLADKFLEGIKADMLRYAPVVNGRNNPNFSPTLYEAAKDRFKQYSKQRSALSLSVGTGENWDQLRAQFMGFIGGDAPTAQAAPPPMDMQFPSPTTLPSQGEPGASFTFTPEPTPQGAPPADPAQAATLAALPADVTQISGADLQNLDDATLQARYGQSGLEYAQAKRYEYAQQVQAQEAAARKTRLDAWEIQMKELAKRTDLTGDQRIAMQTVTNLLNKPALTDSEAQTLVDAFHLLTPRMYDAASWQKVLDTKDPAVILAQLPAYQQYAPQVVAGFDPSGLQAQVQADLETKASQAAQNNANAQKNAEDANRTATLLPGEVAQQKADQQKTGATTAQTTQETRGAAYDLAVKRLTAIAGTNATVYQITQSNPKLWFELKRDLGVNDAGLTALLQQARYDFNQGVKGKDLELRLKESQILTEGAKRGETIANTNMTLEQIKTEIATRDSKIAKLNADIDLAKAQGRNYDSLTAERDALVGQRAALLQAQAGQANATATQTNALTPVKVAQGTAQTANIWADTAKVQADIQNDRARTAAYVQSVAGQTQVDMARVGEITASTALKRAENPNDPLYNPALAASKPGDPLDTLKKQADAYYTQADQALKQANSLQTQINSLTSKAKNFSGAFDPSKLTAEDNAKLKTLTAQRDHLMQVAMNRRASGDKVLQDGLSGQVFKGTGQPAPTGSNSPFTTLKALPSVKLTGISPALVQRVDTMLGSYTAPGGLVPVINQGFRTAEDQAALYALGRDASGKIVDKSKVVTYSKPGTSNHEGGNAIDISWMDPSTGKVVPENDPRAQRAWKLLGAQAPLYGLTWGGTFRTADGKPFVDMRHFEVNPNATPRATARPAAPQAKASAPSGGKVPDSRIAAGMKAAIMNKDGTALNTYGNELLKAGWTQAQVMALIKQYQGGK